MSMHTRTWHIHLEARDVIKTISLPGCASRCAFDSSWNELAVLYEQNRQSSCQLHDAHRVFWFDVRIALFIMSFRRNYGHHRVEMTAGRYVLIESKKADVGLYDLGKFIAFDIGWNFYNDCVFRNLCYWPTNLAGTWIMKLFTYLYIICKGIFKLYQQ